MEVIKCPFTGKMIPKPASRSDRKLDMVDPQPLPPEVTISEKERVTTALADIRIVWRDAGPSGRAGGIGDKLMRAYRKLSLEYWHLTGNHPPPIHADM